MTSKLTPPDKTRCQAEYKESSFMTLGSRELIRCINIPVYIVTESKPGEDGQKGSMSLCISCAEKLKEIMGEGYATFETIQPERTKGRRAR